jgi:hypothetical protein
MATIALPLPTQHWLRRHWLSVIMLAAYLLLSLLVIEQGRVIQAQHSLIQALFSDSLQLNVLRVEKHQAEQHAQPQPKHSSAPELQR